MKKNILIAVILCLIAGLSGLAIAGVNKWTAPIIEENERVKETKLYKEIFETYDDKFSMIKEDNFINKAVLKRVIAYNSQGERLGYIYKVKGKNSYGAIVLLIGIDASNKLVKVEFLTNEQSYSTIVFGHVTNNYVPGLEYEDVANIDTTCGATYGAKTVKELVEIAFVELGGEVIEE